MSQRIIIELIPIEQEMRELEAREFLENVLNESELTKKEPIIDVDPELDFGYRIEEKRTITKRLIKEQDPVQFGDQQVILEMTAAIRELSAEVKQLREQIKDKPQGYYSETSVSGIPYHMNPTDRMDTTDYMNLANHMNPTNHINSTDYMNSTENHNIRGEPENVSYEETTASFEETTDSYEETTQAVGNTGKKKKKKAFSIIGNLLFYLMLVGIVLGAFLLRSSSGGKPFTFAGYSAFTVLTSSMEDVIPKGSLVITKSVDAKTLKVGDDITYMSGPSSTITHRIISITESYADTKARAFETKGTMNKAADKELVPAANVVGKVIYHNKTIGDIANFIKVNWPFILFVVVVVTVLFCVLKHVLREDEPVEDHQNNKKIR